MFNFIFKNVSGSFFRTIGRILVYLLIGFIIACFSGYINLSSVKASTVVNNSVVYNEIFGTDLDTYANFYDYSTSTLYGALVNYQQYMNNDTTSRYEYAQIRANGSFTSGSSGLAVSQCSYSFIKGNYYTVTYMFVTPNYLIHNSYNNGYNKLGLGSDWSSALRNLNITPTSYNGGANKEYLFSNTYLQILTLSFKADKNASCIALPFNKNGGGLVSTDVYFVGMRVSYAGQDALSSSEVAEIVQAEAYTINENIDSMKEQQEETNQKIQETNDYLMDDTAPDSDISSLGNVQGLLPAGPVDSLLNIPFKFLSVITSSMGGSCTPVSGNFVFDSELTLPCFSELIWDNNSVPTDLLNWLSLIPSAFILIKYFKHLYKKVERAVSMETTSDDEWGVI